MPAKKTGLDSLSERQREILVLISKGYQPKEIAGILGIGASTIRGHTEEARQKLNVSSTRAAARMYTLSIDLVPLRQNDGGEQNRVEQSANDTKTLGHEHTNFSDHERTEPNDPQKRSGGRTQEINASNETRNSLTHSGDDFQSERGRWRGSSGNNADVRHDRVSRYLAVSDWLKKLNLIQWAGIILVMTLVIITIIGGALNGLDGMFQSIINMSGHTE